MARANDQHAFDKPLPASPEAERMILGNVLLDNDALEQADVLAVDDFFLPPNRLFYSAMLQMRAESKPIDPLTLQEELERAGLLDQCGGPFAIAALFDGVPRFSNIEEYVRIVRDKARLRRLAKIGAAITSRALDDEIDIEEQLLEAERSLVTVGEGSGQSHWQDAGTAASNYLAKAEARGASEKPIVGFSTGFYDLDYTTLGLERKLHTIIAARPGVGKTAMGLSLSINMSVIPWNLDDKGRPPVVAWFSMEMPAEQLVRRAIATLAGLDSRRLHMGQLQKDEWKRSAYAMAILANLRMHFDDRCGLSIPKIREALRLLRKQEKQVDVVVVDYMQLGDGGRRAGQPRHEEVGAFSRGLTETAKEQDFCLVSLSQMNRESEGRANNKPKLSDLRESGQLEQDAAVAIGLHREESAPGEAEAIILKQRNGPCTSVRLGYNASRTWFYEPARRQDEWDELLARFGGRKA